MVIESNDRLANITSNRTVQTIIIVILYFQIINVNNISL